jgi:hypothetical protein
VFFIQQRACVVEIFFVDFESEIVIDSAFSFFDVAER